MRPSLLAVAAVLILAGCAATPPRPEPQRHRCVTIPNDLVECEALPEAALYPSSSA